MVTLLIKVVVLSIVTAASSHQRLWVNGGLVPLRVRVVQRAETPAKSATKPDRNGQSFSFPSLSALHSRDDGHFSTNVVTIPNDLYREIQSVAQSLWKDTNPAFAIPNHISPEDLESTRNEYEARTYRGEATLPKDVPYSERGEYFREQAMLHGCPKAQHSYALLLWNAFGGVRRDARASARFHAAAALQHNLDAVAVLGGCLRTGTGVRRNVVLGLSLIDFSASNGNPSGVNKKAALLESNGDDVGAFRLYQEGYDENDLLSNALLGFNLGWCYVHGTGVPKDVDRGIQLWKEAAEMAPDEGSEEAAYHLSMEFSRDNPVEASTWLDLAADLGLEEAILEQE
mmetsp:Transcript_48534/g.117407  ORF Transcript_48534/g.117407 Transcript_48534/m.117407 type:complete len:343 (+) Transcript_48534:72-1100(+)